MPSVWTSLPPLCTAGSPGRSLLFSHQRRKGRKHLREDVSPDAQGAQGLLGDVTGPSGIRWKLGLNSRSTLVHVLGFLSQSSSAALGDPGPASGCPQAHVAPRGGAWSHSSRPRVCQLSP